MTTDSAPNAPKPTRHDAGASSSAEEPKTSPEIATQIGQILSALALNGGNYNGRRGSSGSGGANGLLTSISPGHKRRSSSANSQPAIMVARMAQYMGPQSLIIGLVYLVRFLGVWSRSDSADEPAATTEQVQIWFVTAAVLADKFVNDDTYDDILPAMGVVSELRPESLRIEESQMLAALLCHATMFVTPAEFHQCLTAVQQRSWARMDRPTVLAAMNEVLSGEEAALVTTNPSVSKSPRQRRPSRGLVGERAAAAGSAIGQQVRGLAGRKTTLPTASNCVSRGSSSQEVAAAAYPQSAPTSPAIIRQPGSGGGSAAGNVWARRASGGGGGDTAAAQPAPALPQPPPPQQQQQQTVAVGPGGVAVLAPVRGRAPRQRRYTWAGNLALSLRGSSSEQQPPAASGAAGGEQITGGAWRRRQPPASAAPVAAPAASGAAAAGWRHPYPIGSDAATGSSPSALRRSDGNGHRSPTTPPTLDDLVAERIGAASITPPKLRGANGRTSPANVSGGSPLQQRRSRRPSREVTGLDAVPESEAAVSPIDVASPSTLVGGKVASPLGYASALPAIPKTPATR